MRPRPARLLAALICLLTLADAVGAQGIGPQRGAWDCFHPETGLPGAKIKQLSFRQTPLSVAVRTLAEIARREYRLNILVSDDLRLAPAIERARPAAETPGPPGPAGGQAARGPEAPLEPTVTAQFDDAPFRTVFQAIVEANDLECVKQDGLFRVRPTEKLRAELEARNRLADVALTARLKEAEVRFREEEVENRRADRRHKEAEAQVRLRQAQQEAEEAVRRGPVVEDTIKLQYADAEEIARTILGILGLPSDGPGSVPVPLPQLSQLYVPSPPVNIPDQPPPPLTAPLPQAAPSDVVAKGLTVRAYKPTNSVFIRYYARDLERIRALVKERLDVPLPQVQIAAQMVITTLNDLQQVGVQWGGAGLYSVNNRTAVVGSGFADGPARTGPGTPVVGQPTNNPGFTGSQFLPVDPTTGLPVGGSIVNLPTSLLPTLLGATPAGGLLLGIIGQNFALNLAIQALEVQGKARTLAEPKLVTVENSKGVIARGFEVPFTSTPTQGVQNVQFKEALLKLEVTPRVIRDNGETKIRMKVTFENNEPDFSRAVQTAGNPPIFKRRQDADVLVHQGDRLVIGGITNEQAANTYRKVPWLGDLPWLGWLFKAREVTDNKEELIVILTPTVLSDAPTRPAR